MNRHKIRRYIYTAIFTLLSIGTILWAILFTHTAYQKTALIIAGVLLFVIRVVEYIPIRRNPKVFGKRSLLITLIFACAIFLMLSTLFVSPPAQNTVVADIKPDAIIPVTIEENGISAEVSEILIANFHEGANVDVVYRITNNSEDDITPTIYLNLKVDPDKYAKAVGYEIAASYVGKWVKLPVQQKIKQGKTRDFVVSCAMPKDPGKTPKTMAFRTGVAGNTGGQYQTSIETWWLIKLR